MNPLIDPPLEAAAKPIEDLRYILRQRAMIQQRGLPPVMTYHGTGIKEEVILSGQEFNKMMSLAYHLAVFFNHVNHIGQCIMLCAQEKTGCLNLQLKGLKSIPEAVFTLSRLRRLRLDFNSSLNLATPTGVPTELRNLRLLSLRTCGLTALPANIHNLKKINSLNLEENKLEILPYTFLRLRALIHLGKMSF